MPIQNQGFSGVVSEVDGTNFRASRTTLRPIDYGALGFYRLSMATGTIGAALAANAELFHFRWTDATRLCAIYKIMISGGANVAASAAGIVTLETSIARSWTVAGTGGATATITTSNGRLRTSMATTLLGEARIATTAALGGGTKTIDAQGVGNYTTGIGTGAITTAVNLSIIPGNTALFDADGEGQHPIILAQNEGITVENGATAFPAALTWGMGVTVIWAELTAY